jgi:hypothetical protein
MSTKTYTTYRIGRNGRYVPGSPVRKYATTGAEQAARNAARATLTAREIATATVHHEADVWTFTPTTGSPVLISVSY